MQEANLYPVGLRKDKKAQQLSVDIIIPFYKHAELVPPLFDALCSFASELQQMRTTLILINDSPMDCSLKLALEDACLRCKKHNIPFKMLINDENLGFLRATNRGLHASAVSGHDVILLNSDTIPTAGSLTEIQRVAYSDSRIGFVSPRSNNAVHCSLPHHDTCSLMDFDAAYKCFKALRPCLPELTYIPTAVGFCLYVKAVIFQGVGFLDEIYGHGYYEEYDYVFRASRYGYRAVLANYAYVYHKGSASIASKPAIKDTLLKKNRKIFERRYPEYIVDMHTYLTGNYYRAENLLSGLLKDENGKIRIIFDFTHLGFLYGMRAKTARLVLKILSENWNEHFNFFVKCSRVAWFAHKLFKLSHVHFSAKNTNSYAISCRILGESLAWRELVRMSNMAVHNVYFIEKVKKKNNDKNSRQKNLWHFLSHYTHPIDVSYKLLTRHGSLLSPRKTDLNDREIAHLFFRLINHPHLIINQVMQRMGQLSLLRRDVIKN